MPHYEITARIVASWDCEAPSLAVAQEVACRTLAAIDGAVLIGHGIPATRVATDHHTDVRVCLVDDDPDDDDDMLHDGGR
jgi:hypothetical protein